MDWPRTLERLKADVDRWALIAREVGLPRMTVARIGSGETPNPGVNTARKIAEWYAEKDRSAATRPKNGHARTAA